MRCQCGARGIDICKECVEEKLHNKEESKELKE